MGPEENSLVNTGVKHIQMQYFNHPDSSFWISMLPTQDLRAQRGNINVLYLAEIWAFSVPKVVLF